ncbi:hypothetical protein [Flavobacterium defluvii]|uniref:Uncharacterized protein n=1 Tax=Flavobacterium defluvii TaxID=370979 RepID=A0A1M5L0X8_9FLAO|nr:hypothetical protein [Flavobacterium defluvii]SHG58083.1 hypothetical protein SAMN05443663_103225 [Flavobacterium defluvii]
MKKLLLFLLLLSKSVLLSQTILNSFPLNLENPLEEGQILNTEDAKTHDIYVFAADSKNINILKYNKSMFLTTQFSDSIRNEKNRSLIGQSISEDGNPILYWSSQNSRNIRIIKYFLETKASRTLNFDFPENNEYIITSFQKDNNFYILSKEKSQQHLLLYEFKNGNCEIKMFDFSDFKFQTEKGQNLTFNSLIRYYPIQKMELNDFNSLDKASNINKMYVIDDHIILTFDYSFKKTQVFDLNIKTLEVTEKNFDQPVSIKTAKTSNSFYNQNKLYQVKANSDEFLFNIKDFETGKTIKNIVVSKNDTIRFKNSPLFLQTNNNKPQELKTTAKFLKQLSDLSVGVSVLENRKNSYLTFGGYVEYIVSNFEYGQNDFYDVGNSYYSQNKMVFFDAVMNENNDFTTTSKSESLAIDNVFYYLSTNKNVSLQNILKLKDYYILCYYDTVLKQFIIRKFSDGFIRLDDGNPIMNKSVFSKPASFKPIKSR